MASLEPRRPVERVPVPTPPADSGTRRPAPAPRPAAPPGAPNAPRRRAPLLPRRPVAISVRLHARSRRRKIGGTSPGGCTPNVFGRLACGTANRHLVACDCRATSPRLQRHAWCQPLLFGRPGGPARTAVWHSPRWPRALCSASGCSPLEGSIRIPAGPVGNGSQTAESAPTPEAATPASQGDLPEVLPSFTPPVIDGGEQAVVPPTEPVGAPFETVAESAATVPSPQPEVPRATSGSSTGSSTPPAFPARQPRAGNRPHCGCGGTRRGTNGALACFASRGAR